ncbi:hypothetical protein [Jiella sonneratiae]|uniref:DUF1176 domain-containing protein n=1 Tax=Jiella sonneratiae TaxID=2816856 RepID=A0ABS3J058_9HYPH|nr:hypothetical protein [Jiella sonneratiae]MBO0903042.1 hypothetical protein [Jiella sonneratiae]
MRFSTASAFGLFLALLSLQPANAEWRETEEGDWRAAYACAAGGETCVAVSCQRGEGPRFGIWTPQFSPLDADEMRKQRRFDIAIDGAATSLSVDDGEYLREKRVVFWPMDGGLLGDIGDGSTLALRGWGEPKIDIRDEDGAIDRTIRECVVTRAPSEAAHRRGDFPWEGADGAAGAAERLAYLKDVMPGEAACRLDGGDASCRIAETPGSDRNSIRARFDPMNRELAIRAEIADRDDSGPAYRSRLYDVLTAFGIPRSFADHCFGQGAVTLDVAGNRVACDSYTPSDATVATFYITRL